MPVETEKMSQKYFFQKSLHKLLFFSLSNKILKKNSKKTFKQILYNSNLEKKL